MTVANNRQYCTRAHPWNSVQIFCTLSPPLQEPNSSDLGADPASPSPPHPRMNLEEKLSVVSIVPVTSVRPICLYQTMLAPTLPAVASAIGPRKRTPNRGLSLTLPPSQYNDEKNYRTLHERQRHILGLDVPFYASAAAMARWRRRAKLSVVAESRANLHRSTPSVAHRDVYMSLTSRAVSPRLNSRAKADPTSSGAGQAPKLSPGGALAASNSTLAIASPCSDAQNGWKCTDVLDLPSKRDNKREKAERPLSGRWEVRAVGFSRGESSKARTWCSCF